jgi:hypothetical protein
MPADTSRPTQVGRGNVCDVPPICVKEKMLRILEIGKQRFLLDLESNEVSRIVQLHDDTSALRIKDALNEVPDAPKARSYKEATSKNLHLAYSNPAENQPRLHLFIPFVYIRVSSSEVEQSSVTREFFCIMLNDFFRSINIPLHSAIQPKSVFKGSRSVMRDCMKPVKGDMVQLEGYCVNVTLQNWQDYHSMISHEGMKYLLHGPSEIPYNQHFTFIHASIYKERTRQMTQTTTMTSSSSSTTTTTTVTPAGASSSLPPSTSISSSNSSVPTMTTTLQPTSAARTMTTPSPVSQISNTPPPSGNQHACDPANSPTPTPTMSRPGRVRAVSVPPSTPSECQQQLQDNPPTVQPFSSSMLPTAPIRSEAQLTAQNKPAESHGYGLRSDGKKASRPPNTLAADQFSCQPRQQQLRLHQPQ